MKDRRWLFWAFLFGMLILDLTTKQWARGAFAEGQRADYPLPGILEFTLNYNKGIAFGWFPGSALLMTPIALAIAIGALTYSLRNPAESSWTQIAMGLLASGALGNLYDRLFQHRVTDMIYVAAINFPVFNVADACITSAAAMLMLAWAREVANSEKGPAPAPTETAERPVP